MRRESLLTTAVNALDICGVTSLLKPFYGGRGAIIALHRVLPVGSRTLLPGNAVTVSQLREILQFVKNRAIDIVPLGDVPARLGNASSARFIAFTLDDGNRDNFEQALPVFREFGVPFSVFPCTGFLNRTHILWFNMLEALCLHADRFTWQSHKNGQVEFQRSPEEDKVAFFRRVERHSWREPAIDDVLAAACETAGISIEELKDHLFLSWDQLRLLSKDPLVTVGVHTVSHANLGEMDESKAEWEVTTARAELERQLGVPIRHIAYPFGSPEACGQREFRLAQRLGFAVGLTTKRGNIHNHRDSLWSLPRHTLSMVAHSVSPRYLRLSLDGIWDTPLNGTLFTR